MREQDRRDYLEKYQEDKKRGIPFFPNALFKDAIVSLLVFVALVVLSAVIGAELGDQANPSDDSFTPRPEWYFLWLFQLLKFFPGNLEFVGVIILPGAILLILAALPWLDRSRTRNIRGRPIVLGFVVFLFLGVLGLTVQALLAAEPPLEAAGGDPVALLYTENCSGCHGTSIAVPAGVNLGDVISQGGHEGMPAWSGDLSSDEIDALVGFVLSPNGSAVFQDSCSGCHQAVGLAATQPLTLRAALQPGSEFEPHAGLDLPSLDESSATALVNFLIAPDGHRLFVLNCAACHGNSAQFAGTRNELLAIIEKGGGHLTMPAMGGVLPDADIAALAAYVVAPDTAPASSAALFEADCAVCHGTRVPVAESVEAATEIIVKGGSHQTMPVWGDVLTAEQLDALTDYAYEASQGSPAVLGKTLFEQHCTVCHGEFGEGGASPVDPSFTIGPISTEQYLVTRDDITIRAIITQGQPDSGMSPFGLAFGGPLDADEVGAIVAYIRSWQDNPPVELPPAVERAPLLVDVADIYAGFCAQCHGADGEGGIGPSFQSPEWQAIHSDSQLFETIDLGHPATAMIGWGDILTDEQISGLVELIRSLQSGPGTPGPAADVSFAADVLPIFQSKCLACHGAAGGWSAESYQSVMAGGNSGPVIIPGDAENSILAQWLLGTGPGGFMPPSGSLPAAEVEAVLAWIRQGAADN
ncbi:MAG: c-type cytochrome [Actinomycetota bacterium]